MAPAPPPVHAVMFPFPAQGHVNPMMELAKRLLERGVHVTFVNTHYNHLHILRNGASHRHLLTWRHLRFETLPDGLPADHPRLNGNVLEFGEAVETRMRRPLQELLTRLMQERHVTCIIADCLAAWVQDVAEDVGLPRAALWTTPVHANLAYCSMPQLISDGIIPFPLGDHERGSKIVTCIPGLKFSKLLANDLPSFLQSYNGTSTFDLFDWIEAQFKERPRRQAEWNLGNNIYELEKEAIDLFRERFVNSFITIGPLLPPSFFMDNPTTPFSFGTSLWEEDQQCVEWLNMQKPRSVLYISFGSIVHMSLQQVEEIAMGIESSQQPFLWVLRSNVDHATLSMLQTFKGRTQGRGLIVSWSPQLLVISHPSVGGFLTHCGWNSIMESLSAGVPILAWPGGFAEQNMNARYVVDVWRVGIEFKIKDKPIVPRDEVDILIRSIMIGEEGKELRERAQAIKKLARVAISKGQSSEQGLNAFVEAMTIRARVASSSWQCSKKP